MPRFARSFDVDALARWDAAHPGNAVRALFRRWALPGRPSDHATMLRLGVRDGYLNFYVMGQSVAKLSCGNGGPRVEVHGAYVDGGIASAAPDDLGPAARRYVAFGSDDLARTNTADLVLGWIAAAERHATAEKRFVDALIAANDGAIDLEMALPAGSARDERARAAPRMDLVIAQATPGAPVSIAFWEAKCSTNPELRARAAFDETSGDIAAGPKVLHQLLTYTRWMRDDERLAEVRAAYGNTATIMLDLHRALGSVDATPAPCLDLWERLAAQPSPDIVLAPGIVIANHCPPGHVPARPGGALLFGRRAESFAPHRDKLARHALVHEVGPDHSEHALPRLADHVASA